MKRNPNSVELIHELPSAEELREILHYDPISGHLTWRKKTTKSGRDRTGKIAGHKSRQGYVYLNRGAGRYWSAHRVIWKIIYGVDAPIEIDHINGVRDDNRIENLRLASIQENKRNRLKRKDSTSPYKGVVFDESRTSKTKPWRAKIVINYKRHDLGRYDTAEEARDAYLAASAKYHGEFGSAG